MTGRTHRRKWLAEAAALGASAFAGSSASLGAFNTEGEKDDGHAIRTATFDFIRRSGRDDGGYAPSPDREYRGNSDTELSDLAGVTYAAVLAKTFGVTLEHADRSAGYVHARQQPDGTFRHKEGKHDPNSDLGVLYDTTQSVVCLRALGQRPKVDPRPVIERMFAGDAYKKLPWYTTSFFPLLYAALDEEYPAEMREKLAKHQLANQAEDGYLGDHVAATFHMVHYFRLIGRPVPKREAMLARVLRDQKPDGGWNIKEPDWDVHSAFDATFILRQLGGTSPRVRSAIDRAADWCLRCHNADGGFGHYPGWHSDMDAVYFQLGTLVMAGRIPGARTDLPDAQTLGWGHLVKPAAND